MKQKRNIKYATNIWMDVNKRIWRNWHKQITRIYKINYKRIIQIILLNWLKKIFIYLKSYDTFLKNLKLNYLH